MTIEQSIKIAFPDEAVWKVKVTPCVPEEKPFYGYSNYKLRYGMPGEDVWFTPYYYVITEAKRGIMDLSNWYRSYQVEKTERDRLIT